MFFRVITVIAVTVAIFVLAVQTPDPWGESDGIAIPLTKSSDTNASEFHATSHNAKIIRGPSGMDGSESSETPHPFAVRQDESGAGIDLKKYVDGIWYGTIWIGTPPKSFTVQLNTASSDLLVPASTGDQICKSQLDLWDPGPSSHSTRWDLNMDFTTRFADGRTASGKQYQDSVTIAGFTADIQTIGVATAYISNLKTSLRPCDPEGILGLGFPSLSEYHGQSPLFHTLFTEGKLPQPVFSLKLTDSGGELYVGGMNRALYLPNTLAFTPVTYPVFWQLKIDDIRVNGKIVVSNVPAIIDTGANFIYGDPVQVMAVHDAGRGGVFTDSNGRSYPYHTFPCRSFPSVTFTIGGKPFVMSPDVLNLGQTTRYSKNCFSGIAIAHQEHKFWMIGSIFLKQYYTVFDFNMQSPRVGFAELSTQLP